MSSPEKNTSFDRIVQLVVVLTVLGIIAYFVLLSVKSFVWWIVAVLAVLVLIIHRKLIAELIDRIQQLYARNTLLGIAATAGIVLAFTPFIAFLFVKTIWDFYQSSRPTKSTEKAPIEDINYTEVPPQEDLKKTMDELRALRESIQRDKENL